jgi:type IV pilus biogenesis protein CpaD/CtpE
MAAIAPLLGCIAPATLPPPDTSSFVEEIVDMSHPVRFDPIDGRLDNRELSALDAFLEDADPEDIAELHVAGTGPLGERRASRIVHALGEMGREVDGVDVREGENEPVIVTVRHRLTVARACVETPDGWPDPALLPAGCANAHNLAQMVEDREDLLVGRPLPPAPARSALSALNRYYGDPDISYPVPPDALSGGDLSASTPGAPGASLGGPLHSLPQR